MLKPTHNLTLILLRQLDHRRWRCERRDDADVGRLSPPAYDIVDDLRGGSDIYYVLAPNMSPFMQAFCMIV